MGNSINIEGYYHLVNAPWGKLFYRLLWHNLQCEGKRILDFGSGFGVTADHFAENNEVVALEPNMEMVKSRFTNNQYQQLTGGFERLCELQEASFDLIFCHNVMEFLENRIELLREFKRVLKPGGCLSIVKHNYLGKVMHKAVFEYHIEDALSLLRDGRDISRNFGKVNEYALSDLASYCEGLFHISRVYGIRTFFGLQKNEFKNDSEWLQKMYELECAVESMAEFQNIAFFHHIILEALPV